MKKYLHFSIVSIGGKLYDVAQCTQGGNRYISGNNNSVSSHAEINALKSLPYNKLITKGSKMIIYVMRFKVKDSNLVLANSKPCYHCLKTLHSYNIKRVVYSNQSGDIERAKIQTLLDTKNYEISSGYTYLSAD